MRNLIPFIPQELVVFMIVGAGLAMIVGARRIASGLLVTALTVIFMPVLLAPLFDTLPGWLLWCVIVVFGLSLLRGLFVVAIGKNSTDHMVGILVADVVRTALLAPFRFIGWLARRLLRQR